VGTANHWLFIPLVFCENRNLDVIREALLEELGYSNPKKYKQFVRQLVEAYREGKDFDSIGILQQKDEKDRLFPNVDGIKFLSHEGGCGGTRHCVAYWLVISRMPT
jgi:altronate hydrolase